MRTGKTAYEANAYFKRESQTYLFSGISSPKKMVGLGGPSQNGYRNVLKRTINPKEIILCDKSVKGNGIINMDIYDAVKQYNPDFIDCDFCRTVITDGDTLVKCFNHLKTHNEKWIISFSFSTRAHGLGNQKTFDWINEHILDNTLIIRGFDCETAINFTTKGGFPKYLHMYDVSSKYNIKLTSYCDTSNMISCIVWN